MNNKKRQLISRIVVIILVLVRVIPTLVSAYFAFF